MGRGHDSQFCTLMEVGIPGKRSPRQMSLSPACLVEEGAVGEGPWVLDFRSQLHTILPSLLTKRASRAHPIPTMALVTKVPM